MARLPKRGLDYYVVSVNRPRQLKMGLLKKRLGNAGYVALDTLYASIYSNGYFIRFDSIEEITNEIEFSTGVEDAEALAIIKGLVSLGFFDEDSFENGYLTSKEIQNQYYFATKERKVRYMDECWLLSQAEMDSIDSGIKLKKIMPEDNSIIPGDNSVFPADNTQSKSKTKRKSNSEKNEKIEKWEIVNSIDFPFKPNYFFKSLIVESVISGFEIYAEALNLFIEALYESSDKDEFKHAFYVTVNELKRRRFKDANGDDIEDEFNYIKSSLESNIHKAAYDLGHKEIWPELKDAVTDEADADDMPF